MVTMVNVRIVEILGGVEMTDKRKEALEAIPKLGAGNGARQIWALKYEEEIKLALQEPDYKAENIKLKEEVNTLRQAMHNSECKGIYEAGYPKRS